MKYKLLGRSGLRVSELCLGTMTFGEEWGYGADEDTSREVFRAYSEAGGNFYDTANRYTEGTSERFLGKFIKETGNRNEAVIATKYSLFTEAGKINDSGNHRKNLVQSVEGSLKRLDTDYIDLLYLHAWDFTTPVEEVMRSLDDLVAAGKVLYIGISDTPAWIISQANTLAELRGWTRFIGLQLEYSLIRRDAERELIPMSEAMDIGITAWGPLAGGALTGKYLNNQFDGERLNADSQRVNERSRVITQKVVDIAEEAGCTPAQVAIRWMHQKWGHVFPVVGSKNPDQVRTTIGALDVTLTSDQMTALDEISQIDLGFPHDFLSNDRVNYVLFGDMRDRILI